MRIEKSTYKTWQKHKFLILSRPIKEYCSETKTKDFKKKCRKKNPRGLEFDLDIKSWSSRNKDK